jgi:indolepyruvate ferredoxin oxidoreductase
MTSDARLLSESFAETVERRAKFLTDYQNAAYAARYRARVEKVKAVEAARAPGKCGLTDAVARYLFKLMAYKDEYEVARLYSDGAFRKQVASAFDGDKLRLEFHLAPPLLARRDRTTGLPRKMNFGPWLLPAFRLLAKFKFLRGTAFDPFGRTLERRSERTLIEDYESMLDEVLAALTPDNHHLAVGLAAIPEKIRGFGHVKQRHLAAAKADEAALLEQFRAGSPALLKAAE